MFKLFYTSMSILSFKKANKDKIKQILSLGPRRDLAVKAATMLVGIRGMGRWERCVSGSGKIHPHPALIKPAFPVHQY